MLTEGGRVGGVAAEVGMQPEQVDMLEVEGRECTVRSASGIPGLYASATAPSGTASVNSLTVFTPVRSGRRRSRIAATEPAARAAAAAASSSSMLSTVSRAPASMPGRSAPPAWSSR